MITNHICVTLECDPAGIFFISQFKNQQCEQLRQSQNWVDEHSTHPNIKPAVWNRTKKNLISGLF